MKENQIVNYNFGHVSHKFQNNLVKKCTKNCSSVLLIHVTAQSFTCLWISEGGIEQYQIYKIWMYYRQQSYFLHWAMIFAMLHIFSHISTQRLSHNVQRVEKPLPVFTQQCTILQHHKSYLITSNILVNVCLFLNSYMSLSVNFFHSFSLGTLRSQRMSWEKQWQTPWGTCLSWRTRAQTKRSRNANH